MQRTIKTLLIWQLTEQLWIIKRKYNEIRVMLSFQPMPSYWALIPVNKEMISTAWRN